MDPKLPGSSPDNPLYVSLAEDPVLTDLARKAYDAYGQATGGKNFRGEPMPAFDDLPETIRNAWRAAARAIR